ncbi:hypothetical protein MAE02_61560 [Microvirga aerophila]|uniref:Uncharacterized protein n=1 Tax=Microvirga aerophila TaxID=670291 RepID=A0A512C2M2_9HYPH|nr:hypothetical protein MAE02_61560 [Microvirga aerophila]
MRRGRRRCHLTRMKAYAPTVAQRKMGSLFNSSLMPVRGDNGDSCSSSTGSLVQQGIAEIRFSGARGIQTAHKKLRLTLSHWKITPSQSVTVVTEGGGDNGDKINSVTLRRGFRRELSPNGLPIRALWARTRGSCAYDAEA